MIDVITYPSLQASVTTGFQVSVYSGPGGLLGPPGPAGGLTLSKIATESISGQRVLIAVGDNNVDYPDLTNAAHSELILGLSANAGLAGSPINVQTTGEIVENYWTWNVGPVFCGQQGQLTQTPPANSKWLRQIGVAVAADKILVQLRPPTLL